MKTFSTLLCVLNGKTAGRPESERKSLRRAPTCESLEGRKLLNATWGGLAGNAGGSPPAFVHHPGDHGMAHGKGPHGAPGDITFKPSVQAQADMTALQTDMKALQAEVPTAITAKINADQAVIQQALASIAPPSFAGAHAGHPGKNQPGSFDPSKAPQGMPDLGMRGPGAPGSFSPGNADMTKRFTDLLTRAGVSSTEQATITADFAAYQNALKTVDPTLTAKINADRAALAKDMPAFLHADHHLPGSATSTSTTPSA